MTSGLLLGCLFGASLCLFGFAVAAPRPRLATTVNRFQRRRQSASVSPDHTRHIGAAGPIGQKAPAGFHHWNALAAGYLGRRGITLARLGTDLELTGSTVEAHLIRKIGYACAGLLLPAAAAVALRVSGTDVPVVLPSVAAVALGAALFWFPDFSLTQAADARRRELRRALSCYLDLVAMSLAGGRGVPEALPSAARIGTGWAFVKLQDTIEHARYVGTTPWEAFADLGQRTGMPELQDLGGALSLVADDGAKIRASLTARASTQRRRQLAEAEGAASKADQSIQLAQVVLACGFFLFLGYPAVVAVLST